MTPSAWKPVGETTSAWKPVAEAPSQPEDAGFFATLGKDIAAIPEAIKAGLSPKGVIDLVTRIGMSHAAELAKSKQSAQQGHYSEAFGHGLAGVVPIVGPMAAQAGEEIGGGQPGQGAAHATELLLPSGLKLAGELPGVAGAAGTAAKVVKAGVKAAAPDVAVGATKAAAGMAASEVLPGGPIKYAAGAYPVYSGVRQIGRGLSKGAAAAKEALKPAAPAAEAVAELTPGQVLAKEVGADWSKLSAEDRAMLDSAAKARANTATQAPPATARAPQPAPAPADAAPGTPAPRGRTAAEELADELAAKRAGGAIDLNQIGGIWRSASKAAAPVTEEPQLLVGGHTPNPIPLRTAQPVRPPLRQATLPPPRQEVIQPTQPEVPAAVEPPKRSLAQTEAAMAQKQPAPVAPEEARSPYTANGDRKSPQLRGQERANMNAQQKAARYADAIDEAGLTDLVLPNWRKMPIGGTSTQQMTEGAMPSWANVHEALQQKGLLDAAEKPPQTSIPYIAAELRKRVSQRLAEEMAK